MKSAKKTTFSIIIALLVIIVFGSVVMLFFSVPDGDAIEEAMAKDDYVTLSDINSSTPILNLLLPDGATRAITFTKNVNLDFKTVTIIYFDDYKSLNTYHDSLNLDEGQVALSRGKALFVGEKEETTSARWIIWA